MARTPHRLIDRSDLLAALDAEPKKVTIISAPAGSGKTSLLRAWVDRPAQHHRLAVMQVTRDQHDAQQFWLALLSEVLQAIDTTNSVEPPAATPAFNGRAMVERVLSVIAGHQGRVVLVIDDLHELTAPNALAHLTRLLTNLPPNARAILATRRDLPLRLHQLRLAGELADIRAADLRFTERETRELLDSSDVTLSAAGAALLHERTEGWAAGLRLAAISLADHPDPERFVTEFSGSERMVTEYLIAELLERQPDDVQRLLLRTSLLDRVNGELADLLTERRDSERILLGLEDANAFVLSLDPERTWFRYHLLFADLLRLELRRRLPGQVPLLHRLAAEWFIGHGQVVEAIRHLQAAGDWRDAARLLADHSFSLTMDGQAHTVRALLRAFPRGADYPELALMRAGRDLAQGRLEEAGAHLAVAGAYAETTTPDRRRRLRVAIASLELSLAARRGDLAGVTEQASFLASPAVGQSEEEIALDKDLRAVALMNLGTVGASLGLPDAEHHLWEGATLAREIGRPYLEVRCLAQLGLASRNRPMADIQRLCRGAVTLAERHGWGEEWIIAPALTALAATMAWTGEFDEAERWLQRTTRVLHGDSGPDIRLLVHVVSGMVHAGRGRHQAALQEFSSAEYWGTHLAGPHALASQVSGWIIAAYARAGRTGEARAVLATLTGDRANGGEIRNATAVICLAESDAAAALRAVQDVLDGAALVVGYVTTVETYLLAGLAHWELGDHHSAKQAAERALALAEPDRLVLPFVVTGAAELLKALPRRETAHAALLADLLDILDGSAAGAADEPLSAGPGELSPGELKVLRYLPTHLSRSEIAAQLSVSVSTVSTHIRSIYAKLQARDRSSAVQRARELRLLAVGRAR